MSYLGRAVRALRDNFAAYGDAIATAGPSAEATDWQVRRLRYALSDALYDGNAYDDSRLRSEFGLYRHTRPILNPVKQIADFWRVHLLGGSLDPDAGDGSEMPSALPIIGASASVQTGIARLWRDSNWNLAKSTLALRGPLLGDYFLGAEDNTERGRVRLRLYHPGQFAEVDWDEAGNVRGYVRVERRPDPNARRRTIAEAGSRKNYVTYKEEVTREGEQVVYRTFKDDQLYPWNGVTAEWSEGYGFVPLWHVQHIDVGEEWGRSEVHGVVRELLELDDGASILNDQIRKVVQAVWFVKGMSPEDLTNLMAVFAASAEAETVAGDRQGIRIGGSRSADADIKPIVTDLDIAGVSAHLQFLVAQTSRKFPEIRFDDARLKGDLSGEALREARSAVEAKCHALRAPYDHAMVRAFQGCLSIGGYRYRESGRDERLADYAPFGPDSWDRGEMDFSIGERPVFAVTPHDRAELDTLVAKQVSAWVDVGLPLGLALKRAGVPPDEIAEAEAEAERRQAEAEAALAAADDGEDIEP